MRVGFVGTSWPERVQIEAFRRGGLVPQALCSGSFQRALQLAKRLGIPEVFETWQSLIQASSIELVSITTPPVLHRDVALAALAAGKHVLCEMPLMSVAEVDEVLQAALSASGRLALVDFELRFTPERREVRRWIRNGRLGRVLSIEVEYRNGDHLDPCRPWSWEHDEQLGGGMLNMVGAHLLDLCCWLVGPIRRLTAQLATAHPLRPDLQTGEPRRVTGDDHAHILLELEGGVLATVTASAVMASRPGVSLAVHGTAGSLKLEPDERLWSLEPGGEWRPVPLADAEPVKPEESCFARGSLHLARALERFSRGEGALPAEAATFEDARYMQRILEEARRSWRDRSWRDIEGGQRA